MCPSTNKAKAEEHAELPGSQSPNKEKLAGCQDRLTGLELDVLWRLSIGDTKPSVSDDLNLSVRTIDMLVDSAAHKLNASSPIHAVAILLRNGELGVTRNFS